MQTTSSAPFTLARRTESMNPSVIREILKLTERPGIVSLAGGLPSPDTFPVQALREATEKVLRDSPQAALQYAASEGYGPLREWVAERVAQEQGLKVEASQVLITTGSQQGLDLVGKLLLDAGSRVLVETPTYLGALQAFTPYEAHFEGLSSDEEGPLPQDLALAAPAGSNRPAARAAYLLPNFQNPSGHVHSAARRIALVQQARALGLPLIEDNPYGDLWFDTPPPPCLASLWPLGVLYLGSFSKILAPGLRLGYVIAPKAVFPKLLQAKQAADLHTPIFNQRIVQEVLQAGVLEQQIPKIRALYKAQCEAMAQALDEHMKGLARWQRPQGGMFFWLDLKAGLDATALLPQAVQAGVAYVPGQAFFPNAATARANSLRLSFVTTPAQRIGPAVAALAQVLRRAQEALPA